MATWIEKQGVEPIVPFLLPQMLTGKTRKNMPDVADYLKKIMMQCSKDAAIGGAKALANRPDATPLLAKIDVPTLIVVGLDDPLYSFEIAQKMHKAIKGSKLHIVPAAAHAAIFEMPDDAGPGDCRLGLRSGRPEAVDRPRRRKGRWPSPSPPSPTGLAH